MRIDFSNLQSAISEANLDNQPVDVAVMYPYGISTSINSSTYKQQINRLKSVLNLPESTTNFLVTHLEQELKQRSSSKKKSYKEQKYQSLCSTLNVTTQQLGSSFRQSDSPVKLITNMSQLANSSIKILQIDNEHPKAQKTKKQIKRQANKDYSYCLKWEPKKAKHKCVKQIPTSFAKVSQQLQYCTHNPQVLNKKKRTLKAGDVYNHLHNDFYRQQYKINQKKRQINQKDNLTRKNHHIAQKKLCNKNNKKLLKNYVPYFKRYDQELGKIANRRMRQSKDYQYDWKTGQKLFEPKLNLSKQSFQRLNLSLSLQKSRSKSISLAEVSKEKEIKNYSPSEKWHLKTNTGKQTTISSLCKSQSLVQSVQSQMFERIADIFFKQSFDKSIDIANRSIAQLSQLSHGQFQVLYPFLISLQQHQNLSKPLFVNLISKFYHNLTLYDQNTLRQQFHKNKKRQKKIKMAPQPEVANLTYHPLLCNLSRSLSKQKDLHFQKVWYI